MSYVAAAYGIVAVTLAAYALYLARDRSELRRSLGAAGPGEPTRRPETPPAP